MIFINDEDVKLLKALLGDLFKICGTISKVFPELNIKSLKYGEKRVKEILGEQSNAKDN